MEYGWARDGSVWSTLGREIGLFSLLFAYSWVFFLFCFPLVWSFFFSFFLFFCQHYASLWFFISFSFFVFFFSFFIFLLCVLFVARPAWRATSGGSDAGSGAALPALRRRCRSVSPARTPRAEPPRRALPPARHASRITHHASRITHHATSAPGVPGAPSCSVPIRKQNQ